MNRYVRPVMFAFEPDVVFQFTKIGFGAGGAPVLDTKNSKGVCDVSLNQIAFTGVTAAASPVITGVTDFTGLYVGMTIVGTGVAVGSTIISMNPGAGTITLSLPATGANTGLTASGGQLTITFGSQFTPFKRLDTYVKLLGLSGIWDESDMQGGVATAAIAPSAPDIIIVENNISIAGLASIVIQLGSRDTGVFVAKNPANGEMLRLSFSLCRSTAI